MLHSSPAGWRNGLWPRWAVPLVFALILGGWLVFAPAGLLGKADAVGYAVCHRIDARSFHLGSRQLPLCARCSGLYLGVVGGIFLQSLSGKRGGYPTKGWLVMFALLAMAFAVDGANSYLTFFSNSPLLYQPGNTLRLVTGTGMGLAVSAFILPAFNQTIWQAHDHRPAFSGWKQAVGLLGLGAAIDLAVLTENPLLLYPLALISAAGVVILLGLIYTMVWVMIARRENRYNNLASAWLPLSAGLATALAQVWVVDIARLALTGTWSGFNL